MIGSEYSYELQTSADRYEPCLLRPGRTNGMSMMAPPRHALVEKDGKGCKGLRVVGAQRPVGGGGAHLLGDEIDCARLRARVNG